MTDRPLCDCHGETKVSKGRSPKGAQLWRCRRKQYARIAKAHAKARAEGRCITCGKPPGERGLREGGVCRPCYGKKLLAGELAYRRGAMKAKRDALEEILRNR